MEIANMVTLGGVSVPYFYLHLPAIHELGVSLTFTPFEADFLEIANVAPPKSCPMFRASLGLLITSVVIWVSYLP